MRMLDVGVVRDERASPNIHITKAVTPNERILHKPRKRMKSDEDGAKRAGRKNSVDKTGRKEKMNYTYE